MSRRLFILLRSFFLSSFLSILLIMRRSGSIYLDSCFSLSRYCCSSAWLEPAGLMTELGFTGVFRGPGEGTLKFCGVRAVTGLWEGCGEGLGRKLLGDGVGPELTLELGCELGGPGCGDGWGGGGIDWGLHLLARRWRGQHGEAALADLDSGTHYLGGLSCRHCCLRLHLGLHLGLHLRLLHHHRSSDKFQLGLCIQHLSREGCSLRHQRLCL